MQDKIGIAAGIVWRFMNQNGSTTVSQLKKSVQLTPSMVDRAIGWLAREGKIEEVQQGKSVVLKIIE